MNENRTVNLFANLALSLAVAVTAAACGSTDADPEANTASSASNTESPSPDVPGPTEAPPHPDDEIVPTPAANNTAPADGATFTFEVAEEAEGFEPGDPEAVTATSQMGDVTVIVARYQHYCDPGPTFVATREGTTLRLTVQRDESVSRCMSVHDRTLRFEGLDAGAWITSVEIVDQAGATRQTADILRDHETAPTPTANNGAPAAGTTFAFEMTGAAGDNQPGGSEAFIAGTSHQGDLTVTLTGFTHYCEPGPVFVASREGSTLRLTLQAPEGPVTRCISTYNQTLRFEGLGVGAWATAVEVVGRDGSTQLTGGVVRAL